MKRILQRFTVLSIITILPFAHLLAQKQYLLLGTYTNSGKSKGIYVYQFNSATGAASEVSNVVTGNPSFVTVSPDNKKVYAVNEDNGPGSVSSFSFDKSSGKLTLINKVPSRGEAPCYVSASKNGKFIAVANYSSGNYLVYPVDANGKIGTPVENRQDVGTGPNKDRQEKAHAHAAYFSPDGKYLFANDLGTDKVMAYNFNDATGKLSPVAPPFVTVKAGSGPRHMVFDAAAKYAYLMTEMGGEVIVYKYNNGTFKELQTISSHPADFKGTIGSADIHLSPDGNFLYASNRGDANSIAIFSRDKNTGLLKLLKVEPTKGIMPRNFNFDPSGNFLLVAHQQSNDVVIFRVDKKTGMLTDTGKRIEVGSPVCVTWIK
ncbi:lactonase family protein [Chitinophaga sp. Cy-1792]|uniref:lactonase family protein n=1 Tax=Chitinophaga sp. Cy-1792 TaxID=2608339 RepID=UPI0014247354|nr:lactonase family protein [Chitinophaga sp. Cy-1792]NIG54118.1 lactonase family protein [Chitinophaga sp. Cy-1792]